MEFACKLYKVMDEVVPEGTVHGMISDAVNLEQSFFAGAPARHI